MDLLNIIARGTAKDSEQFFIKLTELIMSLDIMLEAFKIILVKYAFSDFSGNAWFLGIVIKNSKHREMITNVSDPNTWFYSRVMNICEYIIN